jgi:hypothetical protein
MASDSRSDSGHLTDKVGLALVLGGACQIAWWCSICILFLSTMAAERVHFDFLTFETETAHTSGTITSSAKDVMERQGQADLASYSYSFQYNVASHTLLGNAYSEQSLDEDSVVDVEYVIAAPRNARIVGTTTRRRSGIILVIGAALFFACIAWTLWRIAGLQIRIDAIQKHIESRAPNATWGLLPKFRSNQHGLVTTRGTAWLLLAPIISIALLVLALILVEV